MTKEMLNMVDTFIERGTGKCPTGDLQRTHNSALPSDSPALRPERLSSLLKWAGGKEQELRHILPLLPSFRRYYEPFVGGGAVFFSIQAEQKFINDKSSELIHVYKMVAENNYRFFQALSGFAHEWQRLSQFAEVHARDLSALYEAYSREECTADSMKTQLAEFVRCHTEQFKGMFAHSLDVNVANFLREIERNLISKTARMKRLESKKGKLPYRDITANLESALKSAFYMHLRHLYNRIGEYAIAPELAAAIFFFVREHAYASMFRYNSRGEFNVPYGGISYNRKDLRRKISYLQSSPLRHHLANTLIENMDFEAFLQKYAPAADDFIFLDPPYDSEFSTYTQNEFGQQDQSRLARYLLHQCHAKFMLVIKNTPMIYALYSNQGLNMRAFDKRYLVSFQDRNNREAEHLIITNF
jgi:DNA adenine methylase